MIPAPARPVRDLFSPKCYLKLADLSLVRACVQLPFSTMALRGTEARRFHTTTIITTGYDWGMLPYENPTPWRSPGTVDDIS